MQTSYKDKFCMLKAYWDKNHKQSNVRFLTGSKGKRVWSYLGVNPIEGISLLNIGLGTGRESFEANVRGVSVYGLDISDHAVLEGVLANYLLKGWTTSEELPDNKFDLAVSHLVAQHMTTIDLLEQMKNVLRSLKKEGVFAIQYASPAKDGEAYREDVEAQKMGLVRRTQEEFKRIVLWAGGEIIGRSETKYFNPDKAADNACWNGVRIKRKLNIVL